MNTPSRLFAGLPSLVLVFLPFFVGCATSPPTPPQPPTRDVSSPIRVLNRALYVSLQGDDAHTGLTPETALRSPQKAADLSEPGDVIYFAAGEYTTSGTLFTVRRSGLPGRPVTYAPAPGAKVVFRGSGGWDVVRVSGARHIVIQGFRVIGNAADISLEEARREMNNLKNSRTNGSGIAVTAGGEPRVPSAHVVVRDCEISDFPGNGLYAIHSDYVTFENNVIHRNAYWSPYACSGISVYQPAAIDDHTGYKILIRRNVVYDNHQIIPFFHSDKNDPSKRKVTDGNGIIVDDFLGSQDWFPGATGRAYVGRTLVADNVVFGNGGAGISAFSSLNVDIVHNYAADNNRHHEKANGQIVAGWSRDVRILNNVLVAPAGKPVATDSKNERVTHEHNLYATMDGGVPRFPGELGSNLLGEPGLELVGWRRGLREFHVAPDSPLRGAGAPFPDAGPDARADFFGQARSATAPDIGPFVLPPR